jgi:hypothetical protein
MSAPEEQRAPTQQREQPRRVTTLRLRQMKQQGQKIVCLTAYDALMARIFDEAGVDIILVGDSLGNVFQGHETTIPVTLEEMIYHTQSRRPGRAPGDGRHRYALHELPGLR